MLYIRKIECTYKHKHIISQNCSDGFFLLKMVILSYQQNQRLGFEISCGEDVHLSSDSLCKWYLKLESNSAKLVALFFSGF